jgi:hypothetical protein
MESVPGVPLKNGRQTNSNRWRKVGLVEYMDKKNELKFWLRRYWGILDDIGWYWMILRSLKSFLAIDKNYGQAFT